MPMEFKAQFRDYAIMAARKTVELFYDVLSPYSWIGFEILMRCRTVWDVDVNLQPVLLGGIMKASGNTPPGINPSKAIYMPKDLKLVCHFYDLEPIKMPEDAMNVMMVQGSLPTMRLLTTVKVSHGDRLEDLSREFWRRIFRTGEDHVSTDGLIEACMKVGLGAIESKELLKTSSSTAIKEKLRETTQRAISYGAFGLPVFLARNNGKEEMFFGSDRFHLISKFLDVPWPLTNTNSKL